MSKLGFALRQCIFDTVYSAGSRGFESHPSAVFSLGWQHTENTVSCMRPQILHVCAGKSTLLYVRILKWSSPTFSPSLCALFQAKQLFIQGVNAERHGNLTEGIIIIGRD